MATFLDPRFKDRFAHDKVGFLRNVSAWISNEKVDLNSNVVETEDVPGTLKNELSVFLVPKQFVYVYRFLSCFDCLF